MPTNNVSGLLRWVKEKLFQWPTSSQTPCIGGQRHSVARMRARLIAFTEKNEEASFGTDIQLYIHPEECIDCGVYVPVCPVSAIFALQDLPRNWADYENINAAYFIRREG